MEQKAEPQTENRQRELMEKYSTLRKEKDALEGKLSDVNKELDPLTDEIAQYMADSNLKQVKFDDLGSITLLKPMPRPKYDKEDELEVFDFVASNGGGGIIKPTIHPSRFGSFVKELLEKGKNLPEFIQVFYQPRLMFRKAGEKAED